MSNVLKTYLKPILFGCITVSIFITWFLAGTPDKPPLKGQMADFKMNNKPILAPPTLFRDANGNQKVIADFKGDLLLLNFWATWCSPCIKELPSIARLRDKKKGEAFHVLAISTDMEGIQIPLKFLKKINLPKLPVFSDPKMQLARALGVTVLPTTIIVNKRGYIVGRLVGVAEWDSAEAIDLIDYYKGR